MKKIINNTLMLFSVSLLALSCSDWLEKRPESALTPEQYLTTEANIASYATDMYSVLPTHGQYGYGTFEADKHTDNMAYVTPSDAFAPGYWKVAQTGGSYEFSRIYNCNYFFDVVPPMLEDGNVSGATANINHYIGEMHFFRAYLYFEKLKALGDFPIVTKCLPDNLDILVENSKREPRNEVARFILDELDAAIELMMDTPPTGGKNRLNKACAQLFKSRVALYEGTWLKYFKGTAFVPGGEGWPGKAYNPDYQYPLGDIDAEIDFFLSEAMDAAKAVADAYPTLVENTGTYQEKESDPANPYYEMFASVDPGKYSEVMLYRNYNNGLKVIHSVSAYASRANNGNGTTKSMVDAFLMANGLPYYAQGSGYAGDESVEKVTTGRDSRLKVFLKKPGIRNFWDEAFSEGTTIEPYPDVTNAVTNNKYTTGYALRKGMSHQGKYASFEDETACVVFRAVEAYLNYIEACYEKTGQIDENAARYWVAIRERAKVDADYEKTIAATDVAKEAVTDWGAYSAKQLVDATLYNIRRERRCELMAEGFRNMDVRRWRSMDQMIDRPYHVLGINLWENDNLADMPGSLVEGQTVSPKSFCEYLAPYHIQENNRVYDGYRWNMAHYLDPIAVQHFLITGDGVVSKSTLYQNPYWPTTAGEGAIQ